MFKSTLAYGLVLFYFIQILMRWIIKLTFFLNKGAFFDMYIGDGPVSEETKTEIGENVVNIMRRC